MRELELKAVENFRQQKKIKERGINKY